MNDVQDVGRWRAIAESEEFQTLVRERRKASMTLLAISLGWYGLFLILLVYAKDFMSGGVFADELTVAYVFGLSQFVVTYFVIRAYSKLGDGRFAELQEAALAVADRTAPATEAGATPATAGTQPASPGGPR